MSRLWDRADEWVDHAPCVDNPDFITDPAVLGPERAAAVQTACAGCPVRPECIRDNTAPVIMPWNLKGPRQAANSVWVAGVWLPDTFTAESRRVLEKRVEELQDSLPMEYSARDEGIL